MKQALPCHSLEKPGLVQGHPKHQQSRELVLPASYYPAVRCERSPSLFLGISMLPTPFCPTTALTSR